MQEMWLREDQLVAIVLHIEYEAANPRPDVVPVPTPQPVGASATPRGESVIDDDIDTERTIVDAPIEQPWDAADVDAS